MASGSRSRRRCARCRRSSPAGGSRKRSSGTTTSRKKSRSGRGDGKERDVSRKTKIALPPGTELDFNNEAHYRHIMDEAYEGSDPRPYPPPRTRPERSRFWWFWRFFGFWIRVPARRLWNRFSPWGLGAGGPRFGWRG